jgi:desulfoferrodoxin-like iron-binding protein
MEPAGFALTTGLPENSRKMANQLGKVYICGKCGSQVIVTKGGTGTLKCCGDSMDQKK